MTLKVTMPGKRSGLTFSQLRLFLCFLMYCWSLADPVCGYFLKNCTIRGNLSDPSNMKVLCYNRNLEVIPLDIPLKVSNLDLAMNKISKIEKLDFTDLSNLKILNMSINQISQVDDGALGHLDALQELGLAHNRLTTLSDHLFQGLANLSLLHLDNNLIATISSSSFQPLSSLKTVNLTKNNLYNMKEVQAIVQLPHLQELYIGSNRFTSFQSQEISNTSLKLRVLDLSRNPLEIFRVTGDVFPYLEVLDIAYCGQLGRMEWDVLNRSFLSNVDRLNLSGIEMSFERMGMVLQTVNSSLVHLRLQDLVNGSRLKVKALTDIACHIPKLSVLRLEYNNIGNLSEEFLQSCKHMTEVDISNTGLTQLSEFSFRSIEQISALKLGHNRLSSVPKATRNLPTLKILDLSFNIINKLGCSDFSNLTGLTQLFLFHNQIPNLPGCVFQDLKDLRILKLGSNKILTLNDAFMNGLHKLETLLMAGNKLSSIRKGEFKSLVSLKNLFLFDNQIASMEDGAFEGLVNLTELQLDSNKITQTDIRNTVLTGLPHLRTLDISCNYITYVNDDKLDPPPFSHLTSLENLRIFSQRHKGLSHLPINFLEGLKSLLSFQAGSLNIKDLHPDTFIHTPQLWFLDVSKNEFTALTPKLFHPTPRLNSLYLSKARLQSLDFLIGAKLSRVTLLQVSKNDITVVNETVLQSLPALTYLDMQDNPFTCGCSDAWFVQWMESDNQTQVVGAGEFTCNYPADLKDTKLLDVELQFCTVDLGLYCYISTTCLVLLTLVASFAYHFLKWQVIYGYYLFLAFLYDTKQRNKLTPHGCQYDAFISYNAHDEPWVLRELLPELEGEQGWKLCLHHRDFQPGKPIIDNIMDGIYGSRKTICVISHRYLESEWCSREIQVASFRLFDEQKDVLILVFLEEIPTHQLSPYHRMRKLVKKRTYLSWPRNGEHIVLFWQQLRLALETKDGPAEENPILSGVQAL
nr:toll-like receptor 13 [Oncorhynchus nerka]